VSALMVFPISGNPVFPGIMSTDLSLVVIGQDRTR
jgi:hypothetical protein